MKDYKYLILGAGMTADAAVRGIRDIDPHGTIGLVGSEQDPPYNRPPLSKGLWKGKPIEKIWRRTEEFERYAAPGTHRDRLGRLPAPPAG